MNREPSYAWDAFLGLITFVIVSFWWGLTLVALGFGVWSLVR